MASTEEYFVDVNLISEMVYEENRLNTFHKIGQCWPFLSNCNCIPEKVLAFVLVLPLKV